MAYDVWDAVSFQDLDHFASMDDVKSFLEIMASPLNFRRFKIVIQKLDWLNIWLFLLLNLVFVANRKVQEKLIFFFFF